MKLKLAVVGVLLLAAATATGCGNGPDKPLRVGLLVWPAYELPYLARHLGYYDGDKLQLVEFHSPAEALRAYRSKGIDAVAVTLDYLVQLAALEPEHRAVMVINVSNGADAVLARPGIETLQGLAGRRVGVERSALGAYMLSRLLQHGGLTRDDIQVVSVDVHETPAAYRDGRVDAVVTYEPYRTQVLQQGAVELFSSRDIPGEIVDVLVTDTRVIETRSRQLRALIDGWMRAIEHLEAEPPAAAQVLAHRERLTAEQYLDALAHIELVGRDRNREMLNGAALREAVSRTQSVMREQSLIRKVVSPSRLIDPRFFPLPDN